MSGDNREDGRHVAYANPAIRLYRDYARQNSEGWLNTVQPRTDDVGKVRSAAQAHPGIAARRRKAIDPRGDVQIDYRVRSTVTEPKHIRQKKAAIAL
jgi:hypothetical protein